MSETWPKKIRTTIEPNREIEVDEVEYRNLSGQGLIAQDSTPARKKTGE